MGKPAPRSIGAFAGWPLDQQAGGAQGLCLKTCVTDRSDYYRMLKASHERRRSLACYAFEGVLGVQSLPRLCPEGFAEAQADLPGHRPADYPLDPDALVYGGFGSVLQGDRWGVEFGIAAHVGLLQSVGPLPEKGCLTMGALARPASSYQGLVIDDFFSIAPVPVSQLKEGDHVAASAAKQDFDIAKKCDKQEGLAGSGRKDVIDQAVATVVGAEIDSRHTR